MPVSNAASSSSTTRDFSDVCILILDDDPNMRSLVWGALTRCGCQAILQTSNGRNALQLLSTRKVDLVICDWSMEPMSGLEFLRELRRPERALKVPVIMLTASSEPQDVALAKPFNISGWLVKPIALPQLIKRINAVLSRSAQNPAADQGDAAEVARLAEQYRAKLDNDLRDLEEALAAMQQATAQPSTSLDAAADFAPSWVVVDRLLHNIKGQAGSFGYGLITSVAGLGLPLTRALPGDISLIHHHHDEVHRCVTALLKAMRLILQNDVRGDGGAIGERLLTKLQDHAGQVRARYAVSAGQS